MSSGIDAAMLADVSERVQQVRTRVIAACARAGRSPDAVTVIGASKRQPLERIAAAICAGVVELGENYVQEARDKQAGVAELVARHAGASAPLPRWRLIGNLQRNKAKQAVSLFDAIDTVDRAALAEALDRRAGDSGRTIDVCLQVNLSGEAQKSGVDEAELPGLLAACAPLEHIHVVGLMGVPAASEDPEASRPAFARLRELRDTLCREPGGESLRELSMGMSGDFEIAIEEGASLVRIGTVLFGPRDQPTEG
jgi:pyridoxal phosphate enzyme (YggS family)